MNKNYFSMPKTVISQYELNEEGYADYEKYANQVFTFDYLIHDARNIKFYDGGDYMFAFHVQFDLSEEVLQIDVLYEDDYKSHVTYFTSS